MMKSLTALIQKAKHSTFYLWTLNRVLWRAIPFNGRHKFRISEINDNGLTIVLPYKRKNMNHIKGLHACALATVCEYATGFTVNMLLPPNSCRLILKNIHMTYHYQGKTEASISFSMTKEEIESKILIPLQTSEKIFIELAAEVYDINKNHLCTGLINWQVKKWEKVKTK